METIKVIDFHTHIYPWPKLTPLQQLAKSALKNSLFPLSTLQHTLHSKARTLPPTLRRIIDEVGTPLSVPHLVAESSIEDLQIEMQNNFVTKAVVMPHPPIITNSFVQSECKGISNLIPAVFLDPDEITSPQDLDAYLKNGFKIFKINPIQTGKPAKDVYHSSLVEYLVSKDAIIVLHTGNIESSIFFKLPTGGDIENYKMWFEQFPKGKFLAAHMNFHDADKAILLAEKYSNLNLICSWQPKEVILSAVQKIGSQRVLFGSDWPLLGGNISYKKQQILKLHSEGSLTREDVENIFWKNAANLLNLSEIQ